MFQVSKISDVSSMSCLCPGGTCSPGGGFIPLSPHPPLLKLGHVQDTGTPGPSQPPANGCLPEAREEPPNSFQKKQEGANLQCHYRC